GVAVHTEYERNRLFSDEQKEGPFEPWVHRHQFTEEGEKTRLTDTDILHHLQEGQNAPPTLRDVSCGGGRKAC
ncbi:MAG TPA: hypothetical protein V6D48_17025, partial [Oculatellaceae cyanobacterium]